jgi:hypothetical protein
MISHTCWVFIGWTCGRVMFNDDETLHRVFAIIALGLWLYIVW